jgi:ankyrin repeat protein
MRRRNRRSQEAVVSVCLLLIAVGATEAQITQFVQGRIARNGKSLVVTKDDDNTDLVVTNPEILSDPLGHHVVVHGAILPDRRIRIISAATIDEPQHPLDGALLQMCAYREDPEMVDYLLSQGANASAKTANGNTALFEAIESGIMRMGAPPSLFIAKLLISHGADVNMVSGPYSETPLMAAVQFPGADDLVPILLSAGADKTVNAQSKYGYTALMNARSASIAKQLMAAGAVVNEKNKTNGRIALHLAAGRDSEMVEVLLRSGADAKTLDNERRIPVDFARDALARAKDPNQIRDLQRSIKLLLSASEGSVR